METIKDPKKVLEESLTEISNQITEQSSNSLNKKKYLTKAELAEYWRCSEGKINGLMRQGEISYYKAKSVLFAREEMDTFIEQHRVYGRQDIKNM